MIGNAKFEYKTRDLIDLVKKDLFDKLGNRELASIDLSVPGVITVSATPLEVQKPVVKVKTVEEQIKEIDLPSKPAVHRGSNSVTILNDESPISYFFDRKANRIDVTGGPILFSPADDLNVGGHFIKFKISTPLDFRLAHGDVINYSVNGVPGSVELFGEVEQSYNTEVISDETADPEITKSSRSVTIPAEVAIDEVISVDISEYLKKDFGDGIPVDILSVAPLADPEGNTTTDLIQEYSLEAFLVDSDEIAHYYDVKLKGSGLKKHKTTGEGPEAYWVGMAFPKAEKYFQKRGSFFYHVPEILSWTSPDGEVDDKATFYFSVKKGEDATVDTGVIITQDVDGYYAVYNIDFREVYREGDEIPEVVVPGVKTIPVPVQFKKNVEVSAEVEDTVKSILRTVTQERVPVTTLVSGPEQAIIIVLDARFSESEVVVNWCKQFAPEHFTVCVDASLEDEAERRFPPLPKEPEIDFEYTKEQEEVIADIFVKADLDLGRR